MGAKQAQIVTTLSVQQCSDVFDASVDGARGIGSKMGGLAAKATGKDLGGRFVPDLITPDEPTFKVGVFVPKFNGGGQGNGTAIHLYVWDKGDQRLVELHAPHKLGGGMQAAKLVNAVCTGLRGADPRCSVKTS